MITYHDLNKIEIDSVEYRHELNVETSDLIVAIKTSQKAAKSPRGSLLAFEFTDQHGNKATPNSTFQLSPYMGSFFYLTATPDGSMEDQYAVEMISVPNGATEINVNGRSWTKGITPLAHELYFIELTNRGLLQAQIDGLPQWISTRLPAKSKLPTNRRSTDRGPAEPPPQPSLNSWAIRKEVLEQPRDYNQNRSYYQSDGEKRADQFKVAIICDEFTYNSFAPEFQAVVLEPHNWQEMMEREKPDLFLCESAWSGADSKKRPWKGQIYRSVKFNYENRRELLSILEYCSTNSIPTAFWNKEDPTHYYDRVNDFVDTAARFDYIFTTAEEMLSEYSKFHEPSRVGVIPFAVQPRDFNPITPNEREHCVVFAGAWYDEHKARAERMRQGLDWILQSHLGLKIFDRNYNLTTNRTKFPDDYADYTHPPVTHKTTAKLYRENLVALNINTVTTSQTMFARRAFEIAASGALLVGNYSPGVEKIYGDNTIFYDRGEVMLDDLSDAEINAMTTHALSVTMRDHTYRHRFESILQAMQIPHTPSRSRPTMMHIVASHSEARSAINKFTSRQTEYSRLLLVVSDRVESSLIGEYYASYNSQLVNVISAEIIASESVPTANYMSTADAVWVDETTNLSRQELNNVLMHGEYTRHPVLVSNTERPRIAARNLAPGMRLSALDVEDAILRPSFPRMVLEVD